MPYNLYDKIQRRLFFEGDSLSARAYDGTSLNGHYFPSTLYNSRTYAQPLSYFSYARGSRQIAEIYADINTNMMPFLREGDIIFLWGGINDLGGGGLNRTAQQAWDNSLLPYSTAVIAAGAELIIGTVLACGTQNPSDLQTRINNLNTLIRNNAGSVGYTVCDLAADTHFDDEADASSTTYYQTDKVHVKSAGYDILTPIGITTLNSVLAA